MLSLSKIRDVAAALGYYTEEVELGREDCYAGEGEALGRWIGSAAPVAGFTGPVVTGSLEHLLSRPTVPTPSDSPRWTTSSAPATPRAFVATRLDGLDATSVDAPFPKLRRSIKPPSLDLDLGL